MVISPNFGPALTSKLHWRCLVLDEGHKAKNEATQIAIALRKVVANAQYTLLLTGTPLQNNLRELWALLNLLHPDVFTDSAPFDDAFRIGGRTHAVNPAALGRAHHCLAPFCLRRTKREVEVLLPPKVETRVMCPLSSAQTFWYRRLLMKDSALLERAEKDGGTGAGAASAPAGAGASAPAPSSAAGGALDSAAVALGGASSNALASMQQPVDEASPGGGCDATASAVAASFAAAAATGGSAPPPPPPPPPPSGNDWRRLQNLVMQLRTCCNHPYLFPGACPADGLSSASELAAASGKLKVLDRLLTRLKAAGHRVVIFSQFTAMLDILGRYLTLRGYAFARLDGSTNRVQRTVDILQYNRPGSNLFVFLLSTKAGGLGVNLQSADTCVLYDSDWCALSCVSLFVSIRILF